MRNTITKYSKKGYLDISFGWIFALIVGAIILFGAIYITTKIIKRGGESTALQKSVELKAITGPLEVGFEEESFNTIRFNDDTELSFSCDPYGDFGATELSVAHNVFQKRAESPFQIRADSKYIFAQNKETGKNFYFFTRPFDFPFRISSLIYLSSENTKYCFKNPPEEIKQDLYDLSGKPFQNNIRIDGEEKGCLENSIDVCFGTRGRNCDIKVDMNSKTIKKDGKTVYFYGDSLMYAGIFSSPEYYECQLARLSKRADGLAKLYIDKSSITSCGTDYGISDFVNQIETLQESYFGEGSSVGSFSRGVYSLATIAEDLKDKNEGEGCKLW